jgi:tetratricopeptide (TPR) repeat protein
VGCWWAAGRGEAPVEAGDQHETNGHMQAIELADPADPARDALVAERAGALMWAGRVQDAETVCRSRLDRDHDSSVEGAVRICLAWISVAEGRMRDTLREVELVHRSRGLSDQARGSAWAWASMARVSLGDLDGAAAAAEQARPAAAAGDHATTSLALTCLAVVRELRGDLREALRIIDEGARLADQSPARQGHRYPLHVTRGHILMELDRLQDARRTLETGRRISQELGVRWALASYQVFLGIERFLAGAWDDASAALELAAETGERYSLALGHSVTSLIALHRSNLRGAEEAGARARPGPPGAGRRRPGTGAAGGDRGRGPGGQQ